MQESELHALANSLTQSSSMHERWCVQTEAY